jgi:hypothetical protein
LAGKLCSISRHEKRHSSEVSDYPKRASTDGVSMSGRSILLGIVFASAAASPQQAPPARRIIDVHLHAYTQDERFGSRMTLPTTGELVVAGRDAADHQAATFAAMRRLNVVKAVVSGGDREAELRWKQVAPNQIIIGYSIGDPTKVDLATYAASTLPGASR